MLILKNSKEWIENSELFISIFITEFFSRLHVRDVMCENVQYT
jgi:hypothetical protein